MHGTAHRLHHGCRREAHLVGQRVAVAGRDAHVLGERPVHGVARRPPALAEVAAPGTAVLAAAAKQRGVDRHPVAHADVGHVRAHGRDGAGRLVARHYRVRCGRELTVHDVQSVPRIPHAATWTTTSAGPTMGSGTVVTEKLPGLSTTTARITIVPSSFGALVGSLEHASPHLIGGGVVFQSFPAARLPTCFRPSSRSAVNAQIDAQLNSGRQPTQAEVPRTNTGKPWGPKNHQPCEAHSNCQDSYQRADDVELTVAKYRRTKEARRERVER